MLVWGAAGSSQGNVGIGTGAIAPLSLLTVKGAVSVLDGGPLSSGANGLHLLFDDASDQFHAWIRAEQYGTTNRQLSFLASVYNFTVGKVGINKAGADAHLDVVGEIFGGDGTRGTYLSYSAGNESGIVGTRTNHDLEFRVNNTERMKLTTGGKLEFGTGSGITAANRKAAIRLFRDESEDNTAVSVCTNINHDKDEIVYHKELLDIREDDVIVVNANWGISGTSGFTYNPHIVFGLILADEPTSDYSTTEGSNFIKIMSPKVTHIYNAVGSIVYGPNVSQGQTYSGSAHYGGQTPALAFDNDESTFWSADTNTWNLMIDFGAGDEKTIAKIRMKTKNTNSYGGLKDYKFQGSTYGLDGFLGHPS